MTLGLGGQGAWYGSVWWHRLQDGLVTHLLMSLGPTALTTAWSLVSVVPGPQMPRGLLSPQWSLQGRQQRPLGPGVCAHSAAGTAGRVCTAAGSSRKDAQSCWARGGGWGTKVHSRSGNYRGHAGGCRGPGRQCALPRPHSLPLGTRTTVEPVVKGVRLAGAGAEAGAERAHGGGHQPRALGGGRAPSVSHGACDGVWCWSWGFGWAGPLGGRGAGGRGRGRGRDSGSWSQTCKHLCGKSWRKVLGHLRNRSVGTAPAFKMWHVPPHPPHLPPSGPSWSWASLFSELFLFFFFF